MLVRFRHFAWVVLPVLAVALLVAAAQRQRLFELAWFELQSGWFTSKSALGLAYYRAEVQGLAIDGLAADVSALTYDTQRNTLWTVTNKHAELVELSLQGEVSRRIALRGFGDPEAVEYISPGVLVISDERQQRLVRVTFDDETQVLDAGDGQQLGLGLAVNGNKGFEGLAYDSQGKRLYVAKERDPMRIYEIDGFAEPNSDGLHIVENPQRDARLFVRDLSSLLFDEATGHLLALSEESLRLVELNAEGRVVGTLSLRKGSAGLAHSVPQPEGMAMDARGTLYMVSEPNLFYVFRKPSMP
ncbi:SdiA-regulated domain-containing protein [Pseudomonas typographi]|uniref:SdiA-regulated domain-containing protein n=1 Tax=Pseudomonas typographi TaxID=2715964 RepID=A0ABR7YZB9_9PSED|nr:SdiA-regulated domain-containing protein [Pseudomonas typographi]MBD1585366.1 SdiA-regulated domain-containing protein [Pseudomonas typographi]MBD1598520.1 SdiA-regulated domain-containing protein [Pseudomonas typographi]